MRYTDDTFALYGDLFKEAHAALAKEARVGAIRRGLARMFNPETERALASAVEQGSHQEAALGHAAHAQEQATLDKALNLRKQEQLSKEVEALGQNPGAYSEAVAGREAAEQATQKARGGRNLALGAGGVGLAAGVPAAYAVGHGKGEEGKTRTRNLAFGAGAAAGIAAPTLIRGLGSIARGAGQSGAFPELSGAGYGY